MEDILNLTNIQFNNVLSGATKKMNLDVKLSYSPVNTKGIEEKDLPLYSESIDDERKFTLDDALILKDLVDKG